MSIRWFTACFIGWLCGALLWKVPNISEKFLLFVSIVCGVVAIILFFIRFKTIAKITLTGWLFLCIGIGIFSSFNTVHKNTQVEDLLYANSLQRIEGVISTDVTPATFGGYQFNVAFKKVCSNDSSYCKTLDSKFKARITVKNPKDVVRRSSIVLSGTLLEPKPSPLGDNGTTFADYLSTKNVCCTVSNGIIISSQSPHGLPLFRNKTRALFWNTFHEYLREPNDGIGAGIVYGEKAHISDSLEDTFRTAGLSHIMVLSGSNVSILLIVLLPLLAVIPSRFFRFLLTTLLFLSILFFLGVDPPLVRAVIMASLAYLIKERGNPAHAFRALMISAMIMVSLNPAILLYDVSFHLSFLATLGMVCASGYFEKKFSKITERWGLRETLAVTVAVTLFVYPYSMYQFGTISLFGLIANMLVVPIIPAVMAFGAVLVPVAAIGHWLGVIAALPFKISVAYIVGVAYFVSNIPFATINTHLSLLSMFALYGLGCVFFRKAFV